MTDLTVLQKAREAYRQAEQEIVNASKEFIISSVQNFISEHPEVKSVQWAQYTPYFNDGDPCKFSAEDMGLEFHKEHFQAVLSPRWHDYEDFQVYIEGHEYFSNDSDRAKEIISDFKNMKKEISNEVSSNIFEKIWGIIAA